MSTTIRTSQEPDRRSARIAAVQPSPGRDPVRRRWGRITVGVLAALVGAWVFAALYMSAGDRHEVVVLARSVDRLEVIDRSDLRIAKLSSDPNVRMVGAGRLDEFVGRVAASDLAAGSLLSESLVRPWGERVVADDEAVVGVLVRPGDAPLAVLRRGSPVVVVVRAPGGQSREPVEVEGWVLNASLAALSSRERPVEVVVPAGDAAVVSAAAAEQRTTIVALAE